MLIRPKIHNTICNATSKRQKAALKLCKNVDLMIVIGGRNSSNTSKLNKLCSDNIKTHWITKEEELKKEWFDNVNIVGVTAGASTPRNIIDEIVDKIKSY